VQGGGGRPAARARVFALLPQARPAHVCAEHRPQDYFALQAAASGFDQFIDRPYTGIWDKRLKIVELLAENQLAAAETIFIGDMQHDVETAKHGGVHSCAVLTGYNRLDQLRASEPDVIVEHLGELRQILERDEMD
jgi:phosphoglycolate phosphatase